MATRQLLVISVEDLARHGPEVSEASESAFTKFNRGVTQASGGRGGGSPEELFGDLEPKDVVLSFLSNLFQKKKKYQNQVKTVFKALLQVYSWYFACISDAALCEGLPDDLRTILEEAKSNPPQATLLEEAKSNPPQAPDQPQAREEPSLEIAVERKNGTEQSEVVRLPSACQSGVHGGATDPERPPTDSEIRRAIGESIRTIQPQQHANVDLTRKPSGEETLQMLDVACQMMKSINYNADDKDASSEAFESFRQAVMRVATSLTVVDDEKLNQCEAKDSILTFLLDVHKKHPRRLSQLKSIFVRLLDLEAWQAAIARDFSLQIRVEEIIAQDSEAVKALNDLIDAMQAKRLDEMENALKNAEDAGISRSITDKARRELEKLKAENALSHALRTNNPDEVQKALKDADEAGVERSVIDKALLELPKIKARKALNDAYRAKSPDEFQKALKDAEEAGVERSIIDKARLELQKMKAENALSHALRANNPDEVQKALKDADEAGVERSVIDKALLVLQKMKARHVVWVSIDPRAKGKPVAYPSHVSTQIEYAWSQGDKSVDISSCIPGASGLSVDLTPTGNPSYFKQKSKNGSRSVCRCELAEKGGIITVWVNQGEHNEWKCTEETYGQPRELVVKSEEAIDASSGRGRGYDTLPASGYPRESRGRGRGR